MAAWNGASWVNRTTQAERLNIAASTGGRVRGSEDEDEDEEEDGDEEDDEDSESPVLRRLSGWEALLPKASVP